MTKHATSLAAAALALFSVPATQAQTPGAAPPPEAWRQCSAQSDDAQRLACFDQWAAQQASAPAVAAAAPVQASTGPAGRDPAVTAATLASATETLAALDPNRANGGCRDSAFSEMSRFWELEAGTDCGTFSFRGYRPVSISAVTASSVNDQPSSGNPNNTVGESTDYQKREMRIQLSVRTKLAQNLLTNPDSNLRDSLWLGYSQQSYWQLFNSGLSRPFRNTDHEPEVFYVYPTTAKLPFGWRWRYSGAGIVHQSNGQSDPLSRSWNRYYLMTGLELDNRLQVQAKLWKRISERAENDNNPDIQNYVGRGELKIGWNVNRDNWLGLTARGSLNGHGKGSGRLEWMHTLGEGWMGGKSNLRLHAQLFSGYGDTLLDYNYKRTMFSLGFSLLDF
ncbi:phospholipase A [Comamonas humi]